MDRTNRCPDEHPQWTCDFQIRPSIAKEVRDDTRADRKKEPESKTSIERVLCPPEKMVRQGKHLLKHQQNDHKTHNPGLHHDLDVPVVGISQIIHVTRHLIGCEAGSED